MATDQTASVPLTTMASTIKERAMHAESRPFEPYSPSIKITTPFSLLLLKIKTFFLSNSFIYYIAAALAALAYSFYLITNRKYLIGNISPFMFAFGSNMFAALFSLIFILFNKDFKKIKNIEKKSWILIIAIGLSIGILTRLLLFVGQSMVNATDTGFLYATSPVFALFISYLFLKESLNRSQLVTIILMIVGVLFLTTKGNLVFHAGYIFIIASNLIIGCEKPFSRKAILLGVNPKILTSLTIMIGAAGLFIVTLFTDTISFMLWKIYFFSGLFYFLTILGKNIALSRIKAGIVSSMLLLIPVFTTLIAVLILDEQITVLQSLGGILILVGGYFLSNPVNITGAQESIGMRTASHAHPLLVPAAAGAYIIRRPLMLGLPVLGIVLFGAGILVSQYGLRAAHLDHRAHIVMPVVARMHPQGNPAISSALHQQDPTFPMSQRRLAASEVRTTKPTLELAAWARVRDSIHPQDVSEFLKTFPQTRFAFAARMRLRQFLREPQREGKLMVDLSSLR